MENNLIKNLEKLCKQPGVSGHEQEGGISGFLFEMVKAINSNTAIDSVGNIVSVIENSDKTIILEAHMDETGFTIRKKNGSIVLSPQGIIKGEKIVGDNVFVVGKNIKGKIAINSENDFIFVPENDALKVETGDVVAFERFFSIEGNEIGASALDNRIGCSVLVEILSAAVRNGSKNKLVFIFSRKEEIEESSFADVINTNKDASAIVVDAAYAQPVEFDANAPDVLIPILGNGCALQARGKDFVILESDIKKIKEIAKENKIEIQEEIAPVDLGKTNLAKLQNQGIRRGIVINIPVRNQHRQVSTTNISDANEAVRLISKIVG